MPLLTIGTKRLPFEWLVLAETYVEKAVDLVGHDGNLLGTAKDSLSRALNYLETTSDPPTECLAAALSAVRSATENLEEFQSVYPAEARAGIVDYSRRVERRVTDALHAIAEWCDAARTGLADSLGDQ